MSAGNRDVESANGVYEFSTITNASNSSLFEHGYYHVRTLYCGRTATYKRRSRCTRKTAIIEVLIREIKFRETHRREDRCREVRRTKKEGTSDTRERGVRGLQLQ